MTKSRGILRPRTRWTEAEREILRARYPHEKTERIAKELRRELRTVYQYARKMGLSKTAEYMASPDACRLRRDSSVGVPYRFPKGHVPANKGLRRPGYTRGRMRDTQFRKGHRPHNWRHPIGSTRLVDGYLYEKVREASPWTKAWRQSHYLLWERAGRAIPPGHVIAFKNGDRQRISLDNLECIPRAELARRNHWCRRLPKAMQQVIALRIAIKRKITMRERYDEHDRRSAKAPVRNTRRPQGQGKAARHRTRKGRVRRRGKDHRDGEGGGLVHQRRRRPRIRIHTGTAGAEAGTAAR